ncbi:MAG: hypothetical protein CMP91_12575 [Gammaproteobacteria bacterium]|nr:hypothetical protein [Gammaproteobacteria bacterium]MAY01625.1 hypothetical protein [Gammaproteobacteria bacterium]|tara:strand:+ start:230 stop:1063 length:834 start_codon:yes stop_codon:yes gene_type:complete
MAKNAAVYRPYITYLTLLLIMFILALLFRREAEPVSEEFILGGFIEPEIIESNIPDFASMLDVQEKKDTFFSYLQPYVDAVNQRIMSQRQQLLNLRNKTQQGVTLNRNEMAFLSELRVDYELEEERLNTRNLINRLLKRADIIPSSLALAQAANESAWGTSRFATQGKNFFGQWCYSQGCGIIPNQRPSGASYEVRSFDSVLDSVESYIMNLNTFPSYQHLRDIRLELREEGQPIDGITLSEGLDSYSQRGDEYIEELQSMIHSNNLLELDTINREG